MQNIILVNVPNARTRELVHRLGEIGLQRRGHALLARRHRLHRHRVLQAGHRGDQGLLQVADQRDGGAPARLRPADQAARHRLHQLLRPELDRRHRPRRQEDQEGRRDGRRLLLLRRRGGRQVRRASPARSATAPPRRIAPKPSSACCAPTSPRASPAKTSAPTSPAPTTKASAPSSTAPLAPVERDPAPVGAGRLAPGE